MTIAKFYGNCFSAAFNKEIDLGSDAIKVTLHTGTYTPNQDTHDYANDLTNEVANGNGYTTGGITLSGVSVTYDGGTNKFIFDADDVSWPSSTFTAHYAVIRDSTPGTAATQPLIIYVDFEEDIVLTSDTLSLVWAAGGIATVTVS